MPTMLEEYAYPKLCAAVRLRCSVWEVGSLNDGRGGTQLLLTVQVVGGAFGIVRCRW